MSHAVLRFQRPLNLTGPTAAVYALCPWRSGFLSGDGNGYLIYWDIHESPDGKVIAQIPDRVFCIYPLDDDKLAVGTLSGDLFWIDTTAKNELPKRWRFHEDGLFAFAKLDKRLFAVGGKGKITKWDTKTGTFVDSKSIAEVRLRSICVFDDKLLAVGTANGDVLFVDPQSLRVVDQIPLAHELTIFSIKVIGVYLFTTGRDGQIRIWKNSGNWEQIAFVAGHNTTVNALALGPSIGGTQLLTSVGRDRLVRNWKATFDSTISFDLVKELNASRDGGHVASVNAAIWINDMLVTASDDRSLRVWQLISNKD